MNNNRVQVFTTEGAFLAKWGTRGAEPGQFLYPCGVAVDASGHVYVTDRGNDRVQVFAPNGGCLAVWGTPGAGISQFNDPIGVAVGAGGRVYVADTGNERIQVFGSLPTPTKAMSWGMLKAAYR